MQAVIQNFEEKWRWLLSSVIASTVDCVVFQPFRVIGAEQMVGVSKQGMIGTAVRIYKRDGFLGFFKGCDAGFLLNLSELGFGVFRTHIAEKLNITDYTPYESIAEISHTALGRFFLFDCSMKAFETILTAPLHVAQLRLMVQPFRLEETRQKDNVEHDDEEEEHYYRRKYRQGLLRTIQVIRGEEGSQALFAHLKLSLSACIVASGLHLALSRFCVAPSSSTVMAIHSFNTLTLHPLDLVAAKMMTNSHCVHPMMRPQIEFDGTLDCFKEVSQSHTNLFRSFFAGSIAQWIASVGHVFLLPTLFYLTSSWINSLPDSPYRHSNSN